MDKEKLQKWINWIDNVFNYGDDLDIGSARTLSDLKKEIQLELNDCRKIESEIKISEQEDITEEE